MSQRAEAKLRAFEHGLDKPYLAYLKLRHRARNVVKAALYPDLARICGLYVTRVLVTGAAGFIGRAVVEALHARGHEVLAWTRATVDLRDTAKVHALSKTSARRTQSTSRGTRVRANT